MIGMWRITWTYFSILPVQRWLNRIGAALLVACAVLMTFFAVEPGVAALNNAIVFSFFASIFIAFGPAFSGGFTLRMLSTRSQLHLRRHGRLHVLVGSTLAITLIAALIASPILLSHIGVRIVGPGRGLNVFPQPLMFFSVVWILVALFWSIQIFLAGRPWRLLAVLAATATLLITFRESLFSAPAGVAFLVVTGIAVWLSFAKWYLNILCIPQSPWVSGTRGVTRPTLLERLTRARRESWTPSLAQRQYLLDAASPLLPLAVGCIPVLCLGLPWLLGVPDYLTRNAPMIWMAFPIPMATTYSYLLVRRSRFLWLHSGYDRSALFHVAEKAGARVAALTMTGCMTAFLLVSLRNNPDQAPVIIAYAMEQAALAAFMLYAGMCATRGWDAGGVLLTAGTFAIVIAHLKFIQPLDRMPLNGMVGALVTMLLLAGLLRRYAQHRWLTLDWRIAHLPRPPIRT